MQFRLGLDSFILGALGLLGCAIPGHPAAVRQTTTAATGRVPVLEVPYDPDRYDGHIVLPVKVNGHPLQVILDHGSSTTSLSSAAMSELGFSGDRADSLTIGSSVLRAIPVREENLGGYVGILGASELSHYDFVFDGPARRVRLYAVPADTTGQHWLPPEVTPDDCTPMLAEASAPPGHVFFHLEANGKAVHSMFDSGTPFTNTNLAAARMLGLSETSPNVHRSTAHFRLITGSPILEATGVPLTIGSRHIPMRASTTLYIFEHLPREMVAQLLSFGGTAPAAPELSLGLYAVLDRVFVVSYSTRQVCLAPPAVRS